MSRNLVVVREDGKHRRGLCARSFDTARIDERCLAVVPVLFFLMSCAATVAQDVQRFVSSRAGDRISPKPVPQFEPDRDSATVNFEIDEAVTYRRRPCRDRRALAKQIRVPWAAGY